MFLKNCKKKNYYKQNAFLYNELIDILLRLVSIKENIYFSL